MVLRVQMEVGLVTGVVVVVLVVKGLMVGMVVAEVDGLDVALVLDVLRVVKSGFYGFCRTRLFSDFPPIFSSFLPNFYL